MEPNISKLVLGIRKHRGWLASVYEVFGEEISNKCEAYDDALMNGEALAEKFYYQTELPKVRREMKEWLAEKEMIVFAKESKDRRWKELSELIKIAKERLTERMIHRGEVEKKKEMLSDIKKLEKTMSVVVTEERIEQAREYPIDQLIEIRNGMAKCINHEDKHPSMNCKNNFVYCHSCGYHADAIGVYMKLKNCGFIEAVNTLSL